MLPAPVETMNVLLCTDFRTLEAVVSGFLSELSARVSLVRCRSELVSKVEELKPNVVLLQADMDGSVRVESWKTHIQQLGGIPVIILTSVEGAHAEALDAGARGTLSYPFELDDLRACLEAAVRIKKKVLLVDDSKIVHQMISKHLENEPFDLFHAFDGREGIEAVLRHRPDLIITDIEMPNMGGFEFCSAIKKNPATSAIPVIMSSTLDGGIDIDRGFDAGADDYLTKPVVPEELISRINAMVNTSIREQRETVMVVDDSKVIRAMLSTALGSQGFRCVEAESGEQALIFAEKERPALVVTDGEMPGMHGRDMVRALRKIPGFALTPIVMLTGRDSLVDRAKAKKAGVSEFLSKPFVADKVLVIIERLLAEQKLKREREAMRAYISEAAMEHASDVANQGGATTMHAMEKDITILFTDICGFTPLCEGRSPQDIVTLLNEYYDLMVGALKDNGAVIDKFIGDAIMALFLGTDQFDNAYRAAKAGRAMLDALEQFNAHKADPKDRIHIRVGVNSGRVVMGDLGSRLHRRDFTVIGDTVNTAQRLESKAPRDGVLISDATYRLVKDVVRVETLEPLSLKGKETKILCHVLKMVVDIPR